MRHAPHYFVLGSSAWFEGLATDMQRVRVPVEELPADQTTFTLVDSFTAMGCGEQFGFAGSPPAPLDGLYRWPADQAVLAAYEPPLDELDTDYASYASRPVQQYVEVQVWEDLD